VACNFNCFIETEGLLQVTGSHVAAPTLVVSLQDRVVVTTDH